ncbi:sigma-70 family RNA polymerase sigma factor [Streptomyces sp. NPDC006624]|uniref:RNA polymerase sigma factor n=1 Tax=Streptomyces sp. NPDC006624 TaxID=3154892 RepID=UPI0033B9139F
MSKTAQFEDFYASTFRRVAGHVHLMTGDAHVAEDCTQEAFTRAVPRWERIRSYDVPYAWVRRVAHNLACSRMRQAQRARTALVRLGPAAPQPPADEHRVVVVQSMRELPSAYRQVLVLHHLLDLPVRDVAEHLGIPEATVKTRLARGRRRLAAALEERRPL